MYNESITPDYVRGQLNRVFGSSGIQVKFGNISITEPNTEVDYAKLGISCQFAVTVECFFGGSNFNCMLFYPYEINDTIIFNKPGNRANPKVSSILGQHIQVCNRRKDMIYFNYEQRLNYNTATQKYQYMGEYYDRLAFNEVIDKVKLNDKTKARAEAIVMKKLDNEPSHAILDILIDADPDIYDELNVLDIKFMDAASGLDNYFNIGSVKNAIIRKTNNEIRKGHGFKLSNFQNKIYEYFKSSTNPQLQSPVSSNPISMQSGAKTVYIRPYKSTSNDYIRVRYNQSLYGIMCPLKTTESARVNEKNEMAANVEFVNGEPYINLYDKNMNRTRITLNKFFESKVICSESWDYELNKPMDEVTYTQYGKIFTVKGLKDWDYVHLENGEFSATSSCIPLTNSTDSSRASLGSHMLDQAIPVVGSERPIIYTKPVVKNVTEGSKYDGVVVKVTRDEVHIKVGDLIHVQQYPKIVSSAFHSQCTYKCTVKVGDKVNLGQSLFTLVGYEDGLKLGVNINVAYMHVGYDYEDGIVMRSGILPKFGHKMTQVISEEFDDWTFDDREGAYLHGIIKVGEHVVFDQELIHGITKIAARNSLMREFNLPSEKVVSVKYPIMHEGTVMDVKIYTNMSDVPQSLASIVSPNPGSSKTRIEITIDYINIPKIGDKFTTLYGSKGVLTHIIPDEEMYRTDSGLIIDCIFSPTSTIGRKGLSQLKSGFLANAAKILWVTHADFIKSNDQTKFDRIKSELEILTGSTVYKTMTWDEFIKYHESTSDLESYRIKAKTMESRYSYEKLMEISTKLGIDIEGKQFVHNDKYRVKNPVVINTQYITRLHFIVENKSSSTTYQMTKGSQITGVKSKGAGQKIGEQELLSFMAHGIDPSDVLTLEREQMGDDLVMQLLLLGQGLESV